MAREPGPVAGRTDDRFWLVWCEFGGVPTRKHLTAKSACDEAQRLALENPGRRFVVLAARDAFQAVVPAPTACQRTRYFVNPDDQIPF